MSQSPTADLPPRMRRSRWRSPQPTLSWLVLGSLWLNSVLLAPSGRPESGSPSVASVVAEQNTAVLDAKSGATSPFLVLGGAVLALLAFVVGCVLFFRAAQELWRGQWVSSVAHAKGRHGFYIEAFVLWFVLSVLTSSIVEGVRQAGFSSPVVDALQLQPLVLVALLWAGVRGSSWQMLRDDLGLHRGEGVLREIGAGVLAYLAKLPLTGLGLAAAVSLAALFGTSSGAAAPLQAAGGVIQSGSGTERAVVWAAAVVLAPVGEELVFRGLLWRHLRSLTSPLSWLSRPVFAALASGLVFASLHPQGALAIPALLAEGFAFAMVRDWRGSLIAPITLHVLHNGVLMTFIGAPG